MALQRGFKKFAEELAVQLRRELSIPPHGRLCAFQLAEYLSVPLLKLSALVAANSRCAKPLTTKQLNALHQEVHGVCIQYGRAGRAVIYNDSRAPARQQSDVAHELSHILLRHPLSDIVCISTRARDLEDEAAALSGALLLPRAAALHILRGGIPLAAAADQYGISEQMVQWRCNVSGARQITFRSSR